MREQAARDKPVALPISLSEKASSFGTISRLNHASSRWPRCSRAQLRLRRCPSLIASPRARFKPALLRGSLPGASLVQIGRDGQVPAHSAPFGYDGHPIRRAQALAVTNGLDLAIARDLVSGKLDG